MESVILSTIGDSTVGKTLLVVSYTGNYVYPEYKPTVLNYFNTYVKVDGTVVDLTVWDNSGSADYNNLRPLSFPYVDVFLACFSLRRRSTLDNVKRLWIPEVTSHVTDPVIILVGCKKDDCSKEDTHDAITHNEAEHFARSIGAIKYVETSAFEQSGFADCFESAIRAAMIRRRRSRPRTVTL